MKNIISFILFNRKLSKIKNALPNIKHYKEALDDEWWGLGEACLKASPSEAKKILPLKSLRITSTFSSIGFVYVKFDKSEFERVMYSQINSTINNFITLYESLKLNNRYGCYINNTETLVLLLDALNEDYHKGKGSDVIEIVNFLSDEFKQSKNIKNIEQRMEIELEFIRRINESKQFQ